MPKKRSPLNTVYDIARAAGVSPATVSRVLNGYPNVGEDTRERILGLIRSSGFRPNVNARRLVRGHSGQICFVLSNRVVVHSFHSRILMGVEDYCRRAGQHVVFTTFDYRADDRFPNPSIPPILTEHGGTAGVLLAGVNYPNFLRYLEGIGLRYVVFGNNLVAPKMSEFSSKAVFFDEAGGGEKAADFLLELGHREVIFAGDLSRHWYSRRYEGYRKALIRRRLEPQAIDIQDADSAFELGVRAAGILIHRHPAVSAVLAQDDETACGLLEGLRRVGISVPDRISVMGYDDITEVQYLRPSLTTVRVAKERIGTIMAETLLRVHEKGEDIRKPRLVETEIVVRESCKTVPAPRIVSERRAKITRAGTNS